MSKTYIIIRATTLEGLETAVVGHITAGYSPLGGPFNASAFAPPYNTIAQAMFNGEAEGGSKRELGAIPQRRREEVKARR